MHDGSLENLLIQDHHLIKKNQMLCLTKLNSNELYKIQITIKYKNSTSQSYFEKIFENFNLGWKTIYRRYDGPCFSVQITQSFIHLRFCWIFPRLKRPELC